MSDIHLHKLDLNLLRVFDMLVEECSVTRAGERLGLTQSAISHALNRLRYVFKDDLFVRGPEGMRPTARAAEIAPRVHQALLQLRMALAPGAFNPATTERRFTIACTEYVGAILMPGFVARLRLDAPRAELRILPSNKGVTEALRAGRADVALGSFRRIPDWLRHEPLFTDTRVWVLSADHPLADRELNLERLAELPHLVSSATGEDESAVEGYVLDNGLERLVTRSDAEVLRAFAEQGLRRSVALTTPHFLAAVSIVSCSDVAAVLPRRLAEVFADAYRLKLFDPPYPVRPFEVMSLWHRQYGDQPAVAWLRRVLREVASEL
ncbi:MAG TPA: LysR family transcriptional regulator [Stellaceae bacterium]|nr:LysR family transcriptional regulator [Stellaceae bacterium]